MTDKIKKSPAYVSGFKRTAGLFLFVVLLVIVIRTFVLGIYSIPTHSMQPELQPGDIVLVSKLYYFFGFPPINDQFSQLRLWYKYPQKGEIIVFNQRDNNQETEYLIKRVAAVPGESVILENKSVSRFLPEPQMIILPEEGTVINLNPNTASLYKELIIKEGNTFINRGNKYLINGKEAESYKFKYSHYYVLGDNSSNSIDSRSFGTVPSRDIIGAAVIKIFGDGAPSMLNF